MTGVRKGGSGPFASSDDIENGSGVAGATVTAALDALAGATAALTSDDVANASGVAGASVTAALDALLAELALLQPQPSVSQIGWSTGVASDLLELLPAGHLPGVYEISVTLVVRSASALTTTVFLTANVPNFGAENKSMGALLLSATGLVSTTATRQWPIVSSGSAPITLQCTAASPGGLVDMYGSAMLAATI